MRSVAQPITMRILFLAAVVSLASVSAQGLRTVPIRRQRGRIP